MQGLNLGGCSQPSNDNSQLVNVILAGEEWGLVDELPEDAAHRPQVDALSVLAGAVE